MFWNAVATVFRGHFLVWESELKVIEDKYSFEHDFYHKGAS